MHTTLKRREGCVNGIARFNQLHFAGLFPLFVPVHQNLQLHRIGLQQRLLGLEFDVLTLHLT